MQIQPQVSLMSSLYDVEFLQILCLHVMMQATSWTLELSAEPTIDLLLYILVGLSWSLSILFRMKVVLAKSLSTLESYFYNL